MEAINNCSRQPIGIDNKERLTVYRNEMREELNAILLYWVQNTRDGVNGGFVGRIDENNIPHADAPKGSVLNSRILWAFSSAYKITNTPDHIHLARTAFNCLQSKFIDPLYGGVYWSINANGRPLDTKKQIYALAFAIYGCCAYHEVSHDEGAKNAAIKLYRNIEEHSFDKKHTGYLEAFTRNWQPLEDLRLSAKDANEKKTMNTHLHVLEAYTALYHIWPDEELKDRIEKLLNIFITHIVDMTTGHLFLFFDEKWKTQQGPVSYGHDIEAAWLLLEAAETIKDLPLIGLIKNISIKVSSAALEGLDKDGGMWYEYENGYPIKEKHWWVQAEAMVGFFNTWQLTSEKTMFERSMQAWKYTKQYIKDEQYGEWFWGRSEDGLVMKNQDKVGIWKCPYHNSRACIEIINRINKIHLNQIP